MMSDKFTKLHDFWSQGTILSTNRQIVALWHRHEPICIYSLQTVASDAWDGDHQTSRSIFLVECSLILPTESEVVSLNTGVRAAVNTSFKLNTTCLKCLDQIHIMLCIKNTHVLERPD